VKYIEKGTFPDTRRSFSVMRCNHCENAPCVAICPTNALFTRNDGIVDFDDANCIGCKSCMNACPYDAIFLNPETDTAHKCNYCAHRVDQGLEPSCVIVCPTQSIVTGDLDDPSSNIAQLLARNNVSVRTPEQQTRPKVFYKGADSANLDPLASRIADDGMMWSETRYPRAVDPTRASTARTTYTTEHPMPWKGMVSAYLVTKAIAAGLLVVAAILVLADHGANRLVVGLLAPTLALVFTGVTAALLITDLKKPTRFLYLLTRSNPRSWLVRGAWILAAYTVIGAVWLLGGILDSATVVEVVAGPGALLGAATAGYTAYLFAQCEGRDLWQTPLLLPTLLVQALSAGAATMLVAGVLVDLPGQEILRLSLLGGLLAVAALIAIEHTAVASAHVEVALRAMTRGRYSVRFWLGGVVVGIAVPVVLVLVALGVSSAAPVLDPVCGISVVIGLAAYEDAFVRAGQSVPLS
jgi:Fe-S-cluster-containing dehydrogenase component/formate-dependent nitrite reductase membrane component NrfD